MEEDLVRGQNQDNQSKKRRVICNHSQSDSMQNPNEEHWSCEIFLDGNDQRQRKAGLDRYDGSGIFSNEGCSLESIEHLEACFLEYLNSDFTKVKGDDHKLE
jgi:hypothetical protein